MISVPIIIILGFVSLITIGVCLLYLTLLLKQVRYEKASVMTPGELRFYKVITYLFKDEYYILAQVRLANVVKIKDKYFVWKRFNLLGSKCVDFVLVDKQTGESKLVIELDDRSHDKPERNKRDRFVDRVLKESNVPVLHKRYEKYYENSKLKAEVLSCLSTSQV